MDWIKVKVKHADYDFSGASGDVFKAWIRTMTFVAATERKPTEQQLITHIGKDNYNALIAYISDNDLATLDVIIAKVMEDVSHISARKEHDRKYMSEYRCKTLHKPLPSADVKGKIREEKIREDKIVIINIPPTNDEVKTYCEERKNGIDPARFIDYYSARGWMIGKNKMKDWRAAVRTWEKNQPRGGDRVYA